MALIKKKMIIRDNWIKIKSEAKKGFNLQTCPLNGPDL
jgi:hypothetical protein